ncbi:MAG: SDR family oxidoreductase [Phormidesmis sp.]
MTHVFLAGASRGVGREVAKRLVDDGHSVVALLRSDRTQEELTAMGITIAKGDALDAAAMTQVLSAHSPEVVISTIGGLPESGGTRADFLGNKHLIDAAIAAQANRFILISSIGSGNSAQALSQNVLDVLGPVLKEKAQAEAHLANSGIAYTVIRPGGLVSEPVTGQEVLTEDETVAGSIPRAAVAALVVRCLGSDRAINKIFSAIDLSMKRTEKSFETFEL